nr:hypothetical protein [Tanacetum cinerariifolium]
MCLQPQWMSQVGHRNADTHLLFPTLEYSILSLTGLQHADSKRLTWSCNTVRNEKVIKQGSLCACNILNLLGVCDVSGFYCLLKFGRWMKKEYNFLTAMQHYMLGTARRRQTTVPALSEETTDEARILHF